MRGGHRAPPIQGLRRNEKLLELLRSFALRYKKLKRRSLTLVVTTRYSTNFDPRLQLASPNMFIKSPRLLAFALILLPRAFTLPEQDWLTVLALMGNVYLADFTRTSFGLEVPTVVLNEIEASFSPSVANSAVTL
jgi:hypothetical protein